MDKIHDCMVCSVRHACADDSILLFAPTPILREIVMSHLRDMQVSFQLEGELVRVNTSHTAAMEGLRRRLSAPERGDLRVSRERGARLLAACSLEEYGRHLDTDWFDAALRSDAFTVHFQPIIDTTRQSVFAHECLIRLVSGRTDEGGEIVAAALARGSVHVFDSYPRQLSVRKAAEQFIPGTRVFINFMPSSIYDPAFCMKSTLQAMSGTYLRPEDIVFEVVESERIQDVRHLYRICEYYRKEGFGFALDDVGTGSNSLQMVCDLKPDYIKLDKSLVSRVSGPMYRTAVEKLAEFAGVHGLQVIAEGIETAGTFAMLRQIGISLMQGFHFARPSARMISRWDGLTGDLIQLGFQTDRARSPRLKAPLPVKASGGCEPIPDPRDSGDDGLDPHPSELEHAEATGARSRVPHDGLKVQ